MDNNELLFWKDFIDYYYKLPEYKNRLGTPSIKTANNNLLYYKCKNFNLFLRNYKPESSKIPVGLDISVQFKKTEFFDKIVPYIDVLKTDNCNVQAYKNKTNKQYLYAKCPIKQIPVSKSDKEIAFKWFVDNAERISKLVYDLC